MANEYIISVSQLNGYVGSMLQREALLQGIGVRGEISGFKRHSSGHLYFSLKDDAALVRCVMFRQNAVKLRATLRDGLQVIVRGNVSLYVRDGQYQLYVEDVQEEGEGELYRRFLLLKTRLEAQGLFDAAHKKPLPALPRAIGVVTSRTGAVLQDILSVTRRRFPAMPVILYPVQVQGEGAAASIARGIRRLDEARVADVLIVGRGGGSMEDLWAFNEEEVARAIYACQTPVVSAVGHETDFSIADFAADQRAPTPSAAAELCVPDYALLCDALQTTRTRLRAAVRETLARERRRAQQIRTSAGFARPGFAIQHLRSEVENARGALYNAAHARLAAACGEQETLQGRLRALSPAHVLQRGYAMVRADGHYATSAAALRPGTAMEVVMRDGLVRAKVQEVEKGDRQ